ncbi:hypothetical protein EDB81DRAFT_832470 [Dactylonectria macrodidyma]|uniref:Uncharacterized protein n=1 Tax=Dactylonectria macrodidyma TaxID=307937 RepID=A0A9P9I7S9_9HYPO|nr:hypothetical protein EDB81DRAFT_832470 [Dactylonectria macrodidyma]
MASCSVRFEFYCSEAQELKYTHDLPRSLVSKAQAAGQNAGYNDLFVATVLPFMKEHEAACRGASNLFCENYPFVSIWVSSDIMCELAQEDPHRRPRTCMEILLCKVCGKTEGIKRCGRCKKVDWKVHKKIFIHKDG